MSFPKLACVSHGTVSINTCVTVSVNTCVGVTVAVGVGLDLGGGIWTFRRRRFWLLFVVFFPVPFRVVRLPDFRDFGCQEPPKIDPKINKKRSRSSPAQVSLKKSKAATKKDPPESDEMLIVPFVLWGKMQGRTFLTLF